MKRLTQNSDVERANIKVFTSFEEEYKSIMEDLLREVKQRDTVIEELATKINVKEHRHREYRFAFGNVSKLEDKLARLEEMYVEKLKTCFDHYSRTIVQVAGEAAKISRVASRLKDEQTSFSKAASMLSDS